MIVHIQEHVRFGRVRVIDADARRAHTGTTFDAAISALPRARQSARNHLVFLLHGYGGSLTRMAPLRDQVRAAGLAAEVVQYPSLFRTVGEIAENLANLVIESTRHRARPPAKVSLVGFSMGGLVASGVMRALALRKDAPRLGRLLTIGTPHAGSRLANVMRWAQFLGGPNIADLTTFNRESLAHLRDLPVPMAVIGGAGYWNAYWPILGDGDGIVPIASAVDVAGAVGRFVVQGYKHTALPSAPEVIEQAIAFLVNGRFSSR